MIVRFKPTALDGKRNPDRSRVVLELVCGWGEVPQSRLFDEDNWLVPTLHHMSELEVLNPAVPAVWVPHMSGSLLKLGPLSWHESGFWEDFFNRDVSAVERFLSEAAAIVAAPGAPFSENLPHEMRAGADAFGAGLGGAGRPPRSIHYGRAIAPEFELFKDVAGGYRFRLRGANNEIIAQSQPYESKDAAVDGVLALRTAAVKATLSDTTDYAS
jgi:uncharacterized protein YegP (UPF0339 family)